MTFPGWFWQLHSLLLCCKIFGSCTWTCGPARLQLLFVFSLELPFCFSLYDLWRNHMRWWCFLMFCTGLYEALLLSTMLLLHNGNIRTDVLRWLVGG